MPRPPTKKLKSDKNQPSLPFQTRKGDDREAYTSGDPASSTKEVANDKNGDYHEASLKYLPRWETEFDWLKFDTNLKAMVCTDCTDNGKNNVFVTGCTNFKNRLNPLLPGAPERPRKKVLLQSL